MTGIRVELRIFVSVICFLCQPLFSTAMVTTGLSVVVPFVVGDSGASMMTGGLVRWSGP